MGNLDAAIRWNAADAAFLDDVGSRIIEVDTLIDLRGDRIEFPAHAIVDRNLPAHLPLIAGIERNVPGSKRQVGLGNLRVVGFAAGKPQQKVREGIVLVRSGTAIERGDPAAESES